MPDFDKLHSKLVSKKGTQPLQLLKWNGNNHLLVDLAAICVIKYYVHSNIIIYIYIYNIYRQY